MSQIVIEAFYQSRSRQAEVDLILSPSIPLLRPYYSGNFVKTIFKDKPIFMAFKDLCQTVISVASD